MKEVQKLATLTEQDLKAKALLERTAKAAGVPGTYTV